MNKILLILVAALVAVSMCACSKTSEKNGVIIMATNAAFEPYEYIDNGKICGIDPDIMEEVCRRLGRELKIEDIAFDSIIPEVTSGKAQVGVAGMTVTEDRKKNVNFTIPYVYAYQVIIVKKGSAIATQDDLAGKKIGVQLGTTGDQMCTDMKTVEVVRYAKGPEAVVALKQGKVDAVVIDNAPAKAFVAKAADELTIVEKPLSDEAYAIAVAKDNGTLLAELNGVLAEMQADGTLDKIVNKYFE